MHTQVCPWAGHLTSTCLGLLPHNLGRAVVPSSGDTHTCRALRTQPGAQRVFSKWSYLLPDSQQLRQGVPRVRQDRGQRRRDTVKVTAVRGSCQSPGVRGAHGAQGPSLTEEPAA